MTRNGQRAARTRRTDKESPPEYTYYIRYLSLCPADMEILRYIMDRAMSSSRQAAQGRQGQFQGAAGSP